MNDPLRASYGAVDAAIPPDVANDDQLLVSCKVKALMLGYHARWADQEWQAIAIEQTVTLPVVNPETGRTSRTWLHAGKHDGIVQGYGKTALLEHKTASEEISDPSAPYWRRLTIDGQVSQYVLQAWQSGVRLDATLYDVVRKPSIRPKKLSAAERKQITLTGRYVGDPISEESVAAIAAGGESETLELYGIRLAYETLTDPGRYFQRRTVPRLDSDLAEFASELWEIGKEIQRAQLHGLHFRNTASCSQYGSTCEYLGVCSGHETLEGNDRWERIGAVHEELDGIEGDGRDVLTNSRIKCFMACRRKHHYRYELGIRRRNEEEREALYFGKVWHLAQEAWWQSISTAAQPHEGEQHAAIGSGYPVNAAG